MIRVAWIGATLLAAMASGCASTVGITSGDGEPSASAISDLRVRGDLSKFDLVLGEIRAQRTPAGVLEVQVDLTSDRSSQNEYSYRFQWVNADGRVLAEFHAPWRLGSITPRGREVIRAVAPAPEATDFRLDIQGVR